GLPEIAVGVYDQALMQNRHTGATWLLAPDDKVAELRDFWLKHHTLNLVPFALQGSWQSNMTAATYADKFARVQDYLHAGDCYQVNLAQRFEAHYTGSTWQAYQRLRQTNNAPFSAY